MGTQVEQDRKTRILIVEDESIVAMDMQRRLEGLGYEVVGHVMRGDEALEATARREPDLVLMDIHLKGDIDGIQAAEQIKQEYRVPVIYITAYSDENTLERAKVTEPYGYILKPFQEREIHSAIEMGLYKHKMEQRLLEAKLAAEEGYRAKSEFLANMSHELRTPLNSILGMSDLAREADNQEERDEYLRIVKDAGTSLLHIIDSILDFSRLEAGKLELYEESFNAVDFFEEIIDELWIQVELKGLLLLLDIEEQPPLGFIGDRRKLRQIVVNLLGNAVKFTQSGSVRLTVRTEYRKPKDRGRLRIRVEDTGVGIPDKELKNIFEAFHQIDKTMTKVYSGTGLGLSIVKNLVDVLGGRIDVDSKEGEGTVFELDIPMKTEPKEEPEYPRFEGKTLLYLSYSPKRTALRTGQLKQRGLRVIADEAQGVPGGALHPAPEAVCMLEGTADEVLRLCERAAASGVPNERIVCVFNKSRHQCSGDVGCHRLFHPLKRRDLYRAIEEIVRASDEGSIPAMPEELFLKTAETGGEKQDSSGEEPAEEEHAGTRKAACTLLQVFLPRALHMAEEGEYEELEKLALETRRELERLPLDSENRYIEKTFRLILACRKEHGERVKEMLEGLKEFCGEYTMGDGE